MNASTNGGNAPVPPVEEAAEPVEAELEAEATLPKELPLDAAALVDPVPVLDAELLEDAALDEEDDELDTPPLVEDPDVLDVDEAELDAVDDKLLPVVLAAVALLLTKQTPRPGAPRHVAPPGQSESETHRGGSTTHPKEHEAQISQQ